MMQRQFPSVGELFPQAYGLESLVAALDAIGQAVTAAEALLANRREEEAIRCVQDSLRSAFVRCGVRIQELAYKVCASTAGSIVTKHNDMQATRTELEKRLSRFTGRTAVAASGRHEMLVRVWGFVVDDAGCVLLQSELENRAIGVISMTVPDGAISHADTATLFYRGPEAGHFA